MDNPIEHDSNSNPSSAKGGGIYENCLQSLVLNVRAEINKIELKLQINFKLFPWHCIAVFGLGLQTNMRKISLIGIQISETRRTAYPVYLIFW